MERSDIEYLFKNYFRYKQQKESLEEQIMRLEAKATKITPNYDANNINTTPLTNPKPSKVERFAIKIASAKEKVGQLDQLINATEDLFRKLRPHQRYLVKCVVCNKMTEKEFGKREGITPQAVKINLEKIYKRLENE